MGNRVEGSPIPFEIAYKFLHQEELDLDRLFKAERFCNFAADLIWKYGPVVHRETEKGKVLVFLKKGTCATPEIVLPELSNGYETVMHLEAEVLDEASGLLWKVSGVKPNLKSLSLVVSRRSPGEKPAETSWLTVDFNETGAMATLDLPKTEDLLKAIEIVGFMTSHYHATRKPNRLVYPLD